MPLEVGTVSTYKTNKHTQQVKSRNALRSRDSFNYVKYHEGLGGTPHVAMPLEVGTVSTAPLSSLSINVFIFQKAQFLTDLLLK